LNLADGRAVRAAGQTMVQRAATPGTPDCAALPLGLERVDFVPQVTLEDLSIAGAWRVALCAGRQGEPINVGGLARTDLGRFNASARKAARVLEESPERRVAYVYANPATGLALGAGAAPSMGEYHVFVPGSTLASGSAWDPAWNWPLDVAMGVIGPSRHLLLWGWTAPLSGSARSYGDRAVLLLPVPPGEKRDALLKLAARAAPAVASPLSLAVTANGTALGTIELPPGAAQVWRAIRIPAGTVAGSRGALRVELALPAVAPLEHPGSFPDDRLRLSVEHVTIAAVEPGVLSGRIRGNNADAAYLGSGWSSPEPWGVWSDGKVATLRVPVPAGAGDARLRVLAHAISASGRQDVRVTVAGREVAAWSFASRQADEAREATIPAALLPEGREVEIAFEIARPGPPADSGDSRDLGLGLVDFELARR
jgi:hypothetical protein